MREFIIEQNDAGQRLDKYLFKLLPEAEHSLLYKQLRNKNITLNHRKCKGDEKLVLQDTIQIFMADDTIAKFMKTKEKNNTPAFSPDKFRVVYESENILAVDKPVGELSQKAQADDISMNEYLEAYLLMNGYKAGKTFKPSFCNRLDRNTSGLLLAGKSLAGSQLLSSLLKERTLKKYYLAVVLGKLDCAGQVDAYLLKDENSNRVTVYSSESSAPKNAARILTEYTPLAYDSQKDLTLCRIHLITGKTHQIRAHLSYLGHPVLGDHKYGNESINLSFREKYQLLHAYEVFFPEDCGSLSELSSLALRTQYPNRFRKYFDEV